MKNYVNKEKKTIMEKWMKKRKSLWNALNVISAFKEYLQRHIDSEHEGKKQGYTRKKP